MIEKLTKEQESKLAVYRDKWTDIGLRTDDGIDREVVKSAIAKVYECVGLKVPETIIYLDDPYSGCIGAHLLSTMPKLVSWLEVGDQVLDQVTDQVRSQVGGQIRDQAGDQVIDQAWGQVLDQVRDQVGGQVRGQVLDQVRGQVWDQAWAQVWGQVWVQVWDQVIDQAIGQVRYQVWVQVWDQVSGQVGGQVRGQVLDQVRGQVRDQVIAQVRDQAGDKLGMLILEQVQRCGYGNHDAAWLSFYDFFSRECGLECCSKTQGLIDLSEHVGWWWPFKDAVIVTPYPDVLIRDDDHNLHCENGPALSYPGGRLKVYAWHGVRVPAEWIESPESLDPGSALEWPNQEQRRALCEIIGWDRV